MNLLALHVSSTMTPRPRRLFLLFFPEKQCFQACKPVQCSTLVTTDPTPAPVEVLLFHHCMKVVRLPSLDNLLKYSFEPIPYSKTFLEAPNTPFVVLHTLGSTGQFHSSLRTWEAYSCPYTK